MSRSKTAARRPPTHDPHLPHLHGHKLSSVELTQERLARSDCVVVATDHDSVDLRNAVRKRLGELPSNVDVL